MKRYINTLSSVTLALLSVAATSCAKTINTTATEPTPVSFTTQIPSTKAMVTGTDMKGQKFSILQGTNGTANINFVTPAPTHIAASCDATTGVVTTNPVQLIPIGQTRLNYLGYAPQKAGSVSNGNYEVLYPKPVATPVVYPADQYDIMVAQPSFGTTTDPKCAFTFKHLMTAFELHMKMATAADVTAYGNLNDVVTDAASELKLSITPQGVASLAKTNTARATYSYLPASSIKAISSTKYDSIGTITFFPASYPSERQVSLGFVKKATASYDITGLPTTLESGKRYIIKANVGQKGVTFEPVTVVDWATASEQGTITVE